MKKYFTSGLNIIKILTILVCLAIISTIGVAASGNTGWWSINGTRVSSFSSEVSSSEPFHMDIVSEPDTGDWYPGEVREWNFTVSNASSVDLTGLLYISTSGDYMGSKTSYTVTLGTNADDCETSEPFSLYYSSSDEIAPYPEIVLCGETSYDITVSITLDSKVSVVGHSILTFNLYRGSMDFHPYS